MPEPIEPTARIQVLPEILINQIAAGEVVERPASVLKELVENSLDAGATRVEVRLWQGGLEKIQILDNGCGMSPADLALCLQRHATSKIASLNDLEAISTFGFRGEALASIAAVSRLEIRSRLPESPTGYLVDADFGLMKAPPRPVACPAGTSITVEALFEKLPARQKFMRSPGTESSHCSKVLKELAGGNHQTQFFLSNSDRKVLEFVTSTRAARFAECFRPAWEPMHVVEENEEARLEAFLTPTHLIADRGDIWFYINRRAVKNRGLLAAVRQAYVSTLGPHHEPSGAVYLDIRADWVDVNVHPQKTEVRCYRQESLFPWILSTIKKAISQQRTIHGVATTERTQARPLSDWTPGPMPAMPRAQMLLPQPPVDRAPWSLPPVAQTGPESLRAPLVPQPATTLDTRAPAPWLRYLGQIKASYLVCESDTGLVLVDQHALHEKVRTEELKRRIQAQTLSVQRLLLPKILSLPPELLPLLEENTEALAKVGFEVELFGTNEAVLRARPELIPEDECAEVLQSMLQQLATQRLSPQEVVNQSLHLILATMACHSAIRANHLLSPLEAQTLLSKLDRLEQGWTCPHGRPILFELSYSQIEHHFERA